MTRRALLQSAGACRVAPSPSGARPRAARRRVVVPRARPTSASSRSQHRFEEFRYRAPYQFGGRTVDRVTILNVDCRVRTGDGRRGVGLRIDDARQRLGVSGGAARRRPRRDEGAGRRAARRRPPPATSAAIRSICFARSSRSICARAGRVSRRAALPTPIPKLCTLVVASAFDAAIHDAYGKAFGVSATRPTAATFMTPRPVARPRRRVQGRVPRSLRAGRAARDDAGVPFGRRERSARGRATCARGSTTGCRTRSRSGFRATA